MEEAYFASALGILGKVYGYKSFRPAQEVVVRKILSGRDTLAVMPTGAGKSVCFQIPALIMPGVTIVVSPLISLMKDQVDGLKEQGIAATYLNSAISREEFGQRIRDIEEGRYKLVYVAPERLETNFFLRSFSDVDVSMVAVDEAHCLSHWGHDFRPSYLGIRPFVESLRKRPLVAAFTATATLEVRRDIVNLLELRDAYVHVSGFDRPNLYFSVLHGKDKREYIKNYLLEHRNESGIIYAATRKEVESLCDFLLKNRLKVGKYHAGLEDHERSRTQDDFIYDRLQVIVATNAFGMGIDKSNVRFIIHYNMPQNIESYYQEAGRAGRDGLPAECILLFSAGDIRTQEYLIEHSTDDPERKLHNHNLLRRMIGYTSTRDCLRAYLMKYFNDSSVAENCQNCENCLHPKGKLTEEEAAREGYENVTVDAQKVLSCVARMKGRYGLSLVSEVLKGSSNARVLSLGFDKLSTYGLYKDMTIKEIRKLIGKFVDLGYLFYSNGQYPLLCLSTAGASVLRGQEKVFAPREKKRRRESGGKNTELFERLRKLRLDIARRESVPPYIVFSDATLRAMCDRLPRSMNDMLDVPGVGENKLKRYGKEFLEILRHTTGS